MDDIVKRVAERQTSLAANWKGFPTGKDAEDVLAAIAALEADLARAEAALAETRVEALREAAHIAYRTCAVTRHVTLGQKCADAILARIKEG